MPPSNDRTQYVPDLPSLGRYEVMEQLGRGSMGTVYRARDGVLGRDVAIKTISTTSGDPDLADRLLREARAAAALQHAHVIATYDVGILEARPYLVMELATGGSLRDEMTRCKLDHGRVRTVGVQIASALSAAHVRGILHRDVKPGNILVSGDGAYKLADFGIARLPDSTQTIPGLFVGSPAYAAPESLLRGVYGAASDVYGLGAVLFEALAGEPPYGTGDVHSIVTRMTQPVPRLPNSVPESMARAVAAILVHDPERRPRLDEFIAQWTDASPPGDDTGTMMWNRSARAAAPADEMRQTNFALPPVPEDQEDEDLVPPRPVSPRSLRKVLAVALAIGVGAGGTGVAIYLTRRDPTNRPEPTDEIRDATRLTIESVTASSVHAVSPGYTFAAANVLDGDLRTSWQPAKPVNGMGSTWIELSLRAPMRVSQIAIANGFQTTDQLGDEFQLNSRVKRGRVRFSDGSEIPVTLAADGRGASAFVIYPAKSTRSLRLIVDEVYEGKRWNDVAVSEVEVWGQP